MEYTDCGIKDIYIATEKICEETFRSAMQIMSETEKKDISVAKSEKRRFEMAVTRRLLKKLFGKDTLLHHTEHGAPVIDNYAGNISVSHSGDKVYVAYSEFYKVGIDIQYWSDTLVKVASKYLSDRERAAIQQHDRQSLLRAWTIKEAVYKLMGIKDLSLKSIDSLNSDFSVVSHNGNSREIKIHAITTDDFSLAIAWM